jgi:L-aspartate oxidase
MLHADFLVVGGGIAGLRAAIELAKSGTVLVVTKESLGESNTAYAQGGIAVAMGGDEDIALHLSDTIAAGDGLVNAEAAALLVEQGPTRVEELLSWGTAFDRYAEGQHTGELMRTREGAHSLSRILHAHGDATGREIAVSLLRHARSIPNITFMEWTTTVDLILTNGRVTGATLLDADGQLQEIQARAVLLATGGAGQVYSDTTNPAVATGDGIAMAYRAGAELMDMEFYQFHPTAFALEGAPRFLLSEALRGEGGLLLNRRYVRFMQHYHPQLELAPRDIVARAIAQEAAAGPVYLDLREAGRHIDLATRFPGISAFLKNYNLDLSRDLIPVRPAAHYLMGGIRTDTHGRTSLPGLFAAGEAACTGTHGANRLASNSLLEGLVFGALAAEAMLTEPAPTALPQTSHRLNPQNHSAADVEAWIAELRALMWRDAGLLRNGPDLRRAAERLRTMAQTMAAGTSRRALEARNLHTIAQVIVACALAREESRGAHWRSDFPQHAAAPMHSLIHTGKVYFVQEETRPKAESSAPELPLPEPAAR